VDGGDEVEVVHGGGDDDGPGVANGGDGADEVDELHQAAAKEVAEGVGVCGEDDFAALGLGLAHGSRRGWFFAHKKILVELGRLV